MKNNSLFRATLIAILAISVIALLSAGWNDGLMTGWGMMSPWMMAGWGYNPFGWLVGIVVIVVFLAALVFWVVKSAKKK